MESVASGSQRSVSVRRCTVLLHHTPAALPTITSALTDRLMLLSFPSWPPLVVPPEGASSHRSCPWKARRPYDHPCPPRNGSARQQRSPPSSPSQGQVLVGDAFPPPRLHRTLEPLDALGRLSLIVCTAPLPMAISSTIASSQKTVQKSYP